MSETMSLVLVRLFRSADVIFNFKSVRLPPTTLMSWFGRSDKGLLVGPFVNEKVAQTCCATLRPGDVIIAARLSPAQPLPEDAEFADSLGDGLSLWRLTIDEGQHRYFVWSKNGPLQGLFKEPRHAKTYPAMLRKNLGKKS